MLYPVFSETPVRAEVALIEFERQAAQRPPGPFRLLLTKLSTLGTSLPLFASAGMRTIDGGEAPSTTCDRKRLKRCCNDSLREIYAQADRKTHPL
jgi:hypothetical protein